MEQTLNNAIRDLGRIGAEARQRFPEQKTAEQAAYIRELESRYTMHRERDIHRGAPGPVKTESLGDNIELF